MVVQTRDCEPPNPPARHSPDTPPDLHPDPAEAGQGRTPGGMPEQDRGARMAHARVLLARARTQLADLIGFLDVVESR